ncbi:uncharacterized protein LOC143465947 [Clavelina lepadiformis]|uniref:Uncharacterized protein n=1 Tax=Clavelina lepadiformis TaxID=159417 RepID=A0ABP0EXZ7_CLALP
MATMQTTINSVVMPPPNLVMAPAIINNPPNMEIGRKYAGLYNKLGITQIVLAVLSMVFQIILLALAVTYYDSYAYLSSGLWAGVFFMVSGILGVISAKKPIYNIIVAALTMTIFSALAAASMFGIELAAAIYFSYGGPCSPYDWNCFYYTTPIGLHSMQTVFSFTAFVIAIIHSVYCCAPTSCCSSSGQQQQQVIITSTGYSGPMTANVIPGQPVSYVYTGQPQLGTVTQAGSPPYMYQLGNTGPAQNPISNNPQQFMNTQFTSNVLSSGNQGEFSQQKM